MTMFRVGPAGIPGSIKTDMNNVLNKKFGTTGQDYPPADWPADVNLMGPLPVKSASGAIASFADGADGVPVKSCVVSFLPSGGGGTPSAPVAITGVSGVAVTQLGKNLFDKTSVANDKYLSTTTGLEEPAINYCVSDYIPVFSGVTVYIPASQTARRWFYDKNKTPTTYLSNSGNQAYTPSADGYIRVSILKTQIDLDTYQIEVCSTATTYSAYVTPSVVTDTFGHTIYGGTRDLTTDKASVTQGVITFDGSNDESWGVYSNFNGFYINISDMKNGTRQDGVCNMLTKSTSTAQGQTNAFWLGAGNTRLYIIGVYDSIGSTVEALRTFLSNTNMVITYPLATPTELTGLTPHEIDTLYGDNNIYADTGTTAVEYRADIDLALNA